jgi:DNA-binding HxlR family transcriptional regulator
MAARSYAQSCSMAIFLDELGGRWSLLLVRELMLGPRRFKQLLDGLHGIGPNLLTERLGQLQELDVIRKAEEHDDAKSGTYVLTNKGKELEPILLAMVRWSLKNIPAKDSEKKRKRDELLMVAFRACFRPSSDCQQQEDYEFRIGDTNFVLSINDQNVTSFLGLSNNPAFIFISSSEAFENLINGELALEGAEASGEIKVIGEREAYQRWLSMFTLDSYPI